MPETIYKSRKNEMFSKCWRALALLLAFLQSCPLVAMQNLPAPLSPAAQKIRDEVSRIPIDGKLTVRRSDGTEYHGKLQAINSEEFSIGEVDLKTVLTFPYDQVDQVRKNYGGKGAGGHRISPKKSLIVIGVTVGAIVTILAVALAKDK